MCQNRIAELEDMRGKEEATSPFAVVVVRSSRMGEYAMSMSEGGSREDEEDERAAEVKDHGLRGSRLLEGVKEASTR